MTESTQLEDGVRKNAGERIVDLFHAEGVDAIFAICDFSYNQIYKRADEIGIRIVAPRHESAGVHMADGMARMTGRPQVAMAGMGPGVANLVPGVVTAFIEHVPVVVLATQRTRSTHSAVRRSRFQYTPQIRLFEPVVKYAAVVEGAHRVDETVREAFRQATTGTPGPVYLEVPQDVLGEERDYPLPLSPGRYRLEPQGVTEQLVEQAAELIRGARLPIILAGTAIHTARAHAQLARLAEVLRCPVLTTPGGRGALPHPHPQQLHFYGPPGEEAMQQADCIIAVGTSLGEAIDFGGPPTFAPTGRQRWIYIERDPAAIGVNRQIDLPLVGDLRAVLPQLTSALVKLGPFEPPAELEGWRSQQEWLVQAIVESTPDTTPIHPGRAISEARAAIPDDTVLVLDGGCTGLWDMIYNDQRSNDFLWTSKFGHLGTGLPYAIGAQLAVGSERRVVLVTGDGALGFNVMELETAVRHGLPVVVVVNHDQHWGMERLDQERDLGKLLENRMAWVRYDEIVRAMGGHGELCTTAEEIRPAVQRALASGKPSVVQIVTDPEANKNPPGLDKFGTWYGGDY